MTTPTSLLADANGFARDHAIDKMPRGFVWDMADYIPNRRGAKLEARGKWSYFSQTNLGSEIWGGKHAAFRAGTKLLVGGGGQLYSVDTATGAETPIATTDPGLHNGVMLRDRVWFAHSNALNPPYAITWNGTAFAAVNAHTSAPKATLVGAYKERLIVAGVPTGAMYGTVPTDPSYVYFSPLETAGTAPNVGPLAPWDTKSLIGTNRAITAIYPMTAQILVFHDSSIEKIRGGIPPGALVDTDMSVEVFSEQIGTSDPASVVPWQENVCFANSQGVYLTDGATIRSLTDQGGIGDLWRGLYASRRAGTQVHACVFLDHLFVTVLTNWNESTADEQRPMTLICDLSARMWYRFKNVHATCWIDSEIGAEEVWWGIDSSVASLGQNRLAKLSPLFFGPTEVDPSVSPAPSPDAIDGNGLAVLPHLRTGWMRLGPEGVKRLRHVYVSHLTQTSPYDKDDVLQVGARISPYPHLSPMMVGKLSANPRYTRNRLRVDRRGYGIQLEVRQVLPVYLSRLYDLAVDAWAQDRGKL